MASYSGARALRDRFRALRPVGLERVRASTSPTSPTTARVGPHGTVRIAFDRPEVRNAFRPHTVDELYRALDHARMTPDVGCVLLTGNGPVAEGRRLGVLLRRRPAHPGPRRLPVRRRARRPTRSIDARARAGRLHILEVQRLIRFMPKVVIAVVPGWAAGGGHSLHVVCDLTIASARARPVQADRRRRRQLRRRLRLGLPRPPGRPEVRPRDLLPRAASTPPRTTHADGRGQRRRSARRRSRRSPSSGPPRSTARARPRSGC